jgi:thioredoxin reductase (NADPH)
MNRQSIPLRSTAPLVLIGSEPHTRRLKGALALDDRGFLLTGDRV